MTEFGKVEEMDNEMDETMAEAAAIAGVSEFDEMDVEDASILADDEAEDAAEDDSEEDEAADQDAKVAPENLDDQLFDKLNRAARLMRARRDVLAEQAAEEAERLNTLKRALKLLELKPKMEEKEMADLMGMRLRELNDILIQAEKQDIVARVEPEDNDMRHVVVFASEDAMELAEAQGKKRKKYIPQLSAESAEQLLSLLDMVIDPLTEMGLDRPAEKRDERGGDRGGRGGFGGGRGGDLGGGLGARAQAALLAASPDERRELQAALDIQGPHPLGGVDLVAADGQQVHPQLPGGEGDFQEALDRVAVEQGLRLCVDQLGRLGHRQDGPQLVVHQHHGYQRRIRPQGALQIIQGDVPAPVRLEIGDLIPLPLQGLAGLQYGGVLIGGGDDVLSGVPAQLHRPLDGPVVPLAAAGGEEELLRPAAHGGGKLGPVRLHLFRRLGPQGVP